MTDFDSLYANMIHAMAKGSSEDEDEVRNIFSQMKPKDSPSNEEVNAMFRHYQDLTDNS